VPKPQPSLETEVIASSENDRRQRRRFTAEDKERILREADECDRGQLGALLRREGIYSSHLTAWRKKLHEQGVQGLTAQRPGPKPTRDERDRELERLQRRNEKLERELRIATKLIELQQKAHEILGIALPRIEDNATDGSSSSSDSAARRSR
jgi:transposase-like protein